MEEPGQVAGCMEREKGSSPPLLDHRTQRRVDTLLQLPEPCQPAFQVMAGLQGGVVQQGLQRAA